MLQKPLQRLSLATKSMSKFDRDPLPGKSQKTSIVYPEWIDECFAWSMCSAVRASVIAIGYLFFNWVKTCGAQQIKIQSKTVQKASPFQQQLSDPMVDIGSVGRCKTKRHLQK